MFRNREFRRFAVLFLCLAALSIAIAFLIHPAAGILSLASAAVFWTAFFLFTRRRYRRLADFSRQIDHVLHNAQHMAWEDCDEGELSILHSEIAKMILRIREQNDALKKDKQYLADSLSDIAHQLYTPLTSANLILNLLSKNPDEEERQAFLRELEELLARMDWLIDSLLKISRLDAGVVAFQRERIPVSHLIQAALGPLTIPMELRNIDLSLDVPEGVIIQGDMGWLTEAVQNILKNGMESAGEGGKLRISCAENTLYTEITIRDNGAGFAKEDLPHLFDRFYRGKRAKESGYGIGLAMSKMIINRQNGDITAKNHRSGGAMFLIRFPNTPRPNGPIANTSNEPIASTSFR